MLATHEAVQQILIPEVLITVSEARQLISQWQSVKDFTFEIIIEYNEEGAQLLLAHSWRNFRVVKGNGQEKLYIDTRSLYRSIQSWFEGDTPACPILSRYAFQPVMSE